MVGQVRRLPVDDFGGGIIGFQLDPKAAADSEGESTSKPTTGKGRKAVS